MRASMYSTCQLEDGFHLISIKPNGHIEGVFTGPFETEVEAREFAAKFFSQE